MNVCEVDRDHVVWLYKEYKLVCLECGCIYDKRISTVDIQTILECPLCGHTDVITKGERP